MKRPLLIALCCAALAASAEAADKKKTPAPPDPAQAAMMAKWQQYSTPSDGHRVLDALAGKWDLTVQWWMAPGAPAETSTCTAVSQWILGGRFLHQEATGSSMGQPFKGMGLVGFDNLTRQYEEIWVDNMATGMLKSTGRWDPAARTIASSGNITDCMSGTVKPFRGVTTVTDNDRHLYEFYTTGPDGTEFQSMKITYVRKK